MENLDDYLEEGASAEERQAAEQVLAGLDTIRLEEKIKRAAAQRKRLQFIKRVQLVGLILLALLLVSGIYWWTSGDEEALSTQSSTEEPIEEQTPSEESSSTDIAPPPTEEPTEEETPPVQEEEPQRSQTPDIPIENLPIAQADPLPDPSYPAPSTFLRGQNNQEDSLAKAQLNQLWYTSYPLTGLELDEAYQAVDAALKERNFTRAFINLQRTERTVALNDTLRYLQIYTLLEMGEGEEAQRILNELEAPAAEWTEQQEWYSALSLLLGQDLDGAKIIIDKIAAEENHAYRQQAEKAKRVYGWE